MAIPEGEDPKSSAPDIEHMVTIDGSSTDDSYTQENFNRRKRRCKNLSSMQTPHPQFHNDSRQADVPTYFSTI